MDELSQGFKDWLTRKNLKERTFSEYLRYLNQMQVFDKINQEVANIFLTHHSNNVARAFFKNLISYLKQNPKVVEEYELDMGAIKDIELPIITGRKQRKLPNVLSLSELALIERAFEKEKHRLMFRISYEAGLRVGELMSITLNRINFVRWSQDASKRGRITVFGKGHKEGIALIEPDTMRRLYDWILGQGFLESQGDMSIWKVDDKTMSVRKWAGIMWEASKKAIGKEINTHLLRHTRGTHLLEAGLDIIFIQEFLRHSSIVSTQLYTHFSKEKLESELDKL